MITERRSYQCPAGAWTNWTEFSNLCKIPCEQKSETQTETCAANLNNPNATGTIEKSRTSVCPSGAWGIWQQDSLNCCVPTTETRNLSCPSGETGIIEEKRSKTCPSGQFGAWAVTRNTCVIPPAECAVGDVKCTCGDHPRLQFNWNAYKAGATQYLCTGCAPGMYTIPNASSSSGFMCAFGMGNYPKTVAGDIVCAIRSNGSQMATPKSYPEGCNDNSLYKSSGGYSIDLGCIKWVNGQKVDISGASSGVCNASQYPNTNPTTVDGDIICIRNKKGMMITVKPNNYNGCEGS